MDASNPSVDPFTIATSVPGDIGTHTVTFTYEVAGLAAVTKTFDITVNEPLQCVETVITWTPKVISPITQLVFDPAQTVSFDTSGLVETFGICGLFKFELVPAVGGHVTAIQLPN